MHVWKKMLNRGRASVLSIALATIVAASPLSTPVAMAAPPAASALVVKSPTLKNNTITISVGERQELTVEPKAAADKPHRFESGNSGFFTVDGKGVITGVHEGTTTLSVTAADGARTELTVEVRPRDAQAARPANGAGAAAAGRGVEDTGIVIANEAGTLEVGQVERIIAHVLPYQVIGTTPFTLTTSDASVLAAVDEAKIVEAVKPGTAVVTAATLDGKHKVSVTYTVLPKAAAPELKTYQIEPARFGLVYDTATEEAAKANSAGLQRALRHTADNGFNHLLLEKGKVLYVEPKDTIHMVSNVQLDLNGSEIRLRPNDYPRYVAFLFAEKDATRVLENASIVNGILTGERDEKEKYFPKWSSTPATEGGCTIVFEEGRNNGIRNLTVRKSIGFNMSSGLGSKSYGVRPSSQTPVSTRNMELGGFDPDGKPVESQGRIRTGKALDISSFKTPYYTVGYPLGYMGYPYVNSRIYDAYYYDANMRLLASAQGLMRFRQYTLPEGTAFLHLAFYLDQVPEKGNSDFGDAFAFVENRAQPMRNYIVDCVIEDNFSCGFAACGGQNWLIKDNVFRRNGGRMPGSDIDWEDGWEYMQGDLVEGNSFESRSNVIVCAGSGSVFRNNTFRGTSQFWGRAQYYSLIDNVFESIEGGGPVKVALSSSSDIHCYGNRYTNAAFGYTRQHVKEPFIGTYEAFLTNETFDNTPILQGSQTRMQQCVFMNGKDFAALPAGNGMGCTIKAGSYAAQGTFDGSTVEDATFRVSPAGTLEFRNSTLKNPAFSASVECGGVVLEKCDITVDKSGILVTPNNMATFTIRDSKIKFGPQATPYTLVGGWNATGANTTVTLEKVNFQFPSTFEGYLQKFEWYPKPEDKGQLTYNVTGTDLGKFRQTDAKGEKSNQVFNIKR